MSPLVPAIGTVIASDETAAHISVPMTPAEERSIRKWLVHIGEVDLVEYCVEQCRIDPDKRAYFLDRAKEVPPVIASATLVASSCMACIHRRGRSDLHIGCVARSDLPAVYGEGHPLRQLPADGGLSCASFAGPTCH